MAYCVNMKFPDGSVAIVRMAGKRPPNCLWCDSISTKLCDFSLSHPSQVTHRKTCDAPMCDRHAKSIGPNLDCCPEHAHLAPEQPQLFPAAVD